MAWQVMKDGRIAQSGEYAALVADGTDLAALVDAHTEALDSVGTAVTSAGSGSVSVSGNAAGSAAGGSSGDGGTAGGQRTSSPVSGEEGSRAVTGDCTDEGRENGHREGSDQQEKSTGGKEENEDDGEHGQLISDEEKASGHVSLSVYWAYGTRVLWGAHLPLLLLMQVLWQLLQISSDLYLADYTSNTQDTPSHVQSLQSTNSWTFLEVYSLLSLATGTLVALRLLFVSVIGLITAQAFFHGMLSSVFQAPMAFFDRTPVGRIITRVRACLPACLHPHLCASVWSVAGWVRDSLGELVGGW